jgi:hypothetical protein
MNRADADSFESLRRETRKRETQIASVTRRIESTRASIDKRGTKEMIPGSQNALTLLQAALGRQRALVEFISYDGVISAFVVSDKTIDFIADLGAEDEILTLLESFQFQFGTLRFGRESLGPFMPELKKRADSYLQKLYEKLIKPLEIFVGERDLVIVQAGPLNYVPFHALNNGEKYLIETREIVHAPSASIWRSLNEKPMKKISNALLMGFADENIPLVNHEIMALKGIFRAGKTFTDRDATFENYTANAPKYDLVHLACHGQFRPDNPMFSSLHLADGWVTVQDVCSQRLKAGLVTLSACETGLNKIFAGDEILGLARGFLSAGAASLVVSLWTVNDAAASSLVKSFYTHLQRGSSVAASLRHAQLEFIDRSEHPYSWSPFISIGR